MNYIMSEPYSIPDIDKLREMVGVIPQPFATSPSSKAEFISNKDEDFSVSKDYSVGAFVWYEQKRYRCKDNVTAGEWDAKKWEEAPLDKISYQHGFTSEFSIPLPMGKVITRGIMNAIGNVGAQCQFFEQCGGFYTFDEKICEEIGGYPEGAFLQFFDEEKNELRTVRSLADDNKNNFLADKSLIDGNPAVGKWIYVDDNPPVGVEIDYSDYEDLSDTLFVGTGIPDLYEVPFDSYLQLFAIGTLDCDSMRRDDAEDCQVYFKDSAGERTYRTINGMYFTHGEGTSFLDVYNKDSQTFGSIVLGGWKPYEWIYWNASDESKFHVEKICPISPFTCGVMLSKGDKIRIRNSVKDTPLPTVNPESTGSKEWPKGCVHERMFDDSVLRRNYLVRFANLYKRGVRV